MDDIVRYLVCFLFWTAFERLSFFTLFTNIDAVFSRTASSDVILKCLSTASDFFIGRKSLKYCVEERMIRERCLKSGSVEDRWWGSDIPINIIVISRHLILTCDDFS